MRVNFLLLDPVLPHRLRHGPLQSLPPRRSRHLRWVDHPPMNEGEPLVLQILRPVDQPPTPPAGERRAAGIRRVQLSAATTASRPRADEPPTSAAVERPRRCRPQRQVQPSAVRPGDRQVVPRPIVGERLPKDASNPLRYRRRWRQHMRQRAHVDHVAVACMQPFGGSRPAAFAFAHERRVRLIFRNQ